MTTYRLPRDVRTYSARVNTQNDAARWNSVPKPKKKSAPVAKEMSPEERQRWEAATAKVYGSPIRRY